MTMNTDERLQYLKSYFAQEEKVKVELPPSTRENNGVTIISHFDGTRCGYKFKRGIAWFERKDVHKIKAMYPNIIIHDPLQHEGDAK